MVRVLIVDDDKLARMGLRTMLPWPVYGMEVVGEAANGAKALEFASQAEVDLCFVDLMMPVMSGLEFIRAASEKYPRMRFVVLTCQEDFGSVQTALRLGVLDYISKLELEHADTALIMGRLTEKLREGDAPHPLTASDPDVPWAEALLSRRWLFDRDALDKLSQDMTDRPAPLAVTERLLMRMALGVEAESKLSGLPVPQLTAQGQAQAFLGAYRDALLREAEAGDLGPLMVCLLRAVAMVEGGPERALHADTVAAGVGLSRSYFSTSFSREAGIPFNALVRRERVRMAMRLLRETNLPVPRVAERVGYEDARSFSKLFLELVGETPSGYRGKESG